MTTFAESEVNRLKIDIGVVNDDIRAFQERLQDPNLTPLQRGTAQRNLDRAQARLVTLQAELTAAEAKVASEPTPQPTPPATASQTVKDDAPTNPTAQPVQQVNSNGRVTTTPESVAPTNATPPATAETNSDTGLAAETKTIQETQATSDQPPPGPVAEIANPANSTENAAEVAAVAPTSAGVGAASDDSPTPTPSSTATQTNVAYNQTQITPQPNILGKYSSYTYQAAVYLITPEQYTRLVVNKVKKVNGYQLLFQSGGAPNNVGGARGPSGITATGGGQSSSAFAASDPRRADAGIDTTAEAFRNPFFPVDYYIDSVTIDNALPGKASGAAHMTTGIKINVVEPGSITLIDNLRAAVADQAPRDSSGKISYSSCHYLLVMRFYGYDANGNLVKVGSSAPDGISDPNAVNEKFIPFKISDINWSVANKLVSYEIVGAPIGQMIAGYVTRGTVPYDVELTDSTVGGILSGPLTFNDGVSRVTNTPNAAPSTGRGAGFNDPRRIDQAPAKADAAPSTKKWITNGLMGALTEYQSQLVKDKIYQQGDIYKIEWAAGSEAIRDATIVKKGSINKSATPMSAGTSNDPNNIDGKRVSMDTTGRNYVVTAGQSVLQAIEMVIRNSDYISSQALTYSDEETGEDLPNPNRTAGPVKWYQISMRSLPLNWDPLRNDWSYEITFVISAYLLQNFSSNYFPLSKFRGIHKQYHYWFTGENIDVLDYTANFNGSYHLTVSGSNENESNAAALQRRQTSSLLEMVKYSYSPRSNQSASGANKKANEITANAAEYLYSPSSLGTAKLRIVGDPAWLQQGSLFASADAKGFSYSAFLPDGTINFDSQQVLFEIAWQRPEDYNINTGLADPYAATQAKYGNREPIQSYVYQAMTCVSEFKNGKFEQTIEGTLYPFVIPTDRKPAPVVDDSVNKAEMAKLARQQNTVPKPSKELVIAPTSVTGTTPTSSIAKGVQQTLNPPTKLADPSLAQLTASPVYIQARRGGATPQAALDAARASFAAGTNNYSGSALPGIRTNADTRIVKDGNPG